LTLTRSEASAAASGCSATTPFIASIWSWQPSARTGRATTSTSAAALARRSIMASSIAASRENDGGGAIRSSGAPSKRAVGVPVLTPPREKPEGVPDNDHRCRPAACPRHGLRHGLGDPVGADPGLRPVGRGAGGRLACRDEPAPARRRRALDRPRHPARRRVLLLLLRRGGAGARDICQRRPFYR